MTDRPALNERTALLRAQAIRDIAALVSTTETETADQLAEIIVDSPTIRAAIFAAATVEDLYERLRETE